MFKSSSHLFATAALTLPLLLGGCVVAQPTPYYQQSYIEPVPTQAPVVYASPAPVYYAPAYYGPPIAVGIGFGGGGYRGGWHHRGWR